MKIIRKYSTLQYISDIHLEMRNNTFPRIPIRSNYLALLGDIGDPKEQNYEDFLRYTSYNFDRILLIAGNHEYWRTGQNTDNTISKIITKFNNIEFLNNSQTHLEKYTVLGTTLWSNTKMPKQKACFDKSLNWLENEIKLATKPVIVLTHHLPSYKLVVPEYWNKKYDDVRDRFASDLDYLMIDKVKIWLCGHSHCQIEMKINSTLCGINAFGYPNEYIKNEKDIVRIVKLQT